MTKPITDVTRFSAEEIVEIREYIEKATAGPWRGEKGLGFIEGSDRLVWNHYAELHPFAWQSDFDFILRSRSDLPRVLDALEASYKRIETLTEALKRIAEDDIHALKNGFCSVCFDEGDPCYKIAATQALASHPALPGGEVKDEK